jgi:hypothetical protein
MIQKSLLLATPLRLIRDSYLLLFKKSLMLATPLRLIRDSILMAIIRIMNLC